MTERILATMPITSRTDEAFMQRAASSALIAAIEWSRREGRAVRVRIVAELGPAEGGRRASPQVLERGDAWDDVHGSRGDA